MNCRRRMVSTDETKKQLGMADAESLKVVFMTLTTPLIFTQKKLNLTAKKYFVVPRLTLKSD